MRLRDVSVAFLSMTILMVATVVGFTSKNEAALCANIFYDSSGGGQDSEGLMLSLVLQKFIVSMKPYRILSRPIGNYQKGDLDLCDLNIYIGSSQEAVLSRDFLRDYLQTPKKVLWMGLNIWQLGESLEKSLGLRFSRTLISAPLSGAGEVFYKGKVLKREARGNQIELIPTEHGESEILAEFRPAGSKELLPYLVRVQNRYYMADTFDPAAQDVLLADILQGAP